jgi:tetratricopeptide (TPR) repeat protein
VATALLLLVVGRPAASQPECVDAESCAQAGSAHFIAGEYEAAITAFERAHELAPSPLLLYNIGQAHRATGACDEARAFYDRYLETGDQTAAYLARGHLAGETACPSTSDAPPLALGPDTCAEVVECASESVRLYSEGRYLEAVQYMQAAYAIDPVDVLLYNIARSYEEAGDCQRAAFYMRCYTISGDRQALERAEEHLATLEPCPLAPLTVDVPARCTLGEARAGRTARDRAEGVRSLATLMATAVPRCLERSADLAATAVALAAETIAPPPFEGFTGHPLPVHVYDEWVLWARIERDSGPDLLALVYEQERAVNALCEAVDDGQIPAEWLSDPEGCDDIDWVRSTSEMDALVFSTFLARLAAAALAESDLAGHLETTYPRGAIRLTVLALPDGAPPDPRATHALPGHRDSLAGSRFWTGQFDGDEALELLVVAEAASASDCGGRPMRQGAVILDLDTQALELRRSTGCYYDNSQPYGEVGTLSLVDAGDGTPELLELVTVFDDCDLVDGRPKPWGDGDSEPCEMVTHQRRWTYDEEGDVWSPGEWPPPAGRPESYCPDECDDEWGWDEE